MKIQIQLPYNVTMVPKRCRIERVGSLVADVMIELAEPGDAEDLGEAVVVGKSVFRQLAGDPAEALLAYAGITRRLAPRCPPLTGPADFRSWDDSEKGRNLKRLQAAAKLTVLFGGRLYARTPEPVSAFRAMALRT